MTLRLVGQVEIAELLGVTRQRVHQLSSRADFPAPLADLANGRIWSAEDIEAWAVATGRVKAKRKRAGEKVR